MSAQTSPYERPSQTLAEAAKQIQKGTQPDLALAKFVDDFGLMFTNEEKFRAIVDEPNLIGNQRMDALMGAIAEYLAKQEKLGRVPLWVTADERRLCDPWHTSSLFIDWKREYLTDGMREYLTFASPAEFASRNIFTEERPLRRARGPAPGKADIA